jgi:hypothetical protein
MTQSHMIMLAMSPLILWRIYKRVQRLTVRQQSRLWRHWFGVTFLPLALLAMGFFMAAHPPALASLIGGVAAGGALGWHALRRSGFERVGDAYFMLVAMIFIVRVLYRIFEMATLGPQQTPSFGSSPLTMGIMGVVAGYYLVYASGLLRWRLAQARDKAT